MKITINPADVLAKNPRLRKKCEAINPAWKDNVEATLRAADGALVSRSFKTIHAAVGWARQQLRKRADAAHGSVSVNGTLAWERSKAEERALEETIFRIANRIDPE